MSDSDDSDVAASPVYTKTRPPSSNGADYHREPEAFYEDRRPDIKRAPYSSDDDDNVSKSDDADFDNDPFAGMPKFSSLRPASDSDSDGREGAAPIAPVALMVEAIAENGDLSSADEERDDELSLPDLHLPRTPHAAASTPKRLASQVDHETLSSSRKRRRLPRSILHNSTTRAGDAHEQNAIEEDGQADIIDSSTRKQQRSKPTFVQTPLSFKPEHQPIGHARSAVSVPASFQAMPRTPSRHSTQSTPSTAVRSSALNRTFTAQERAAIADAVETFRAQHGMLQSEVNALIQESRDRGPRRKINGHSTKDSLWRAISAACPGKDSKRLLPYCRKNFHNFKARGGQWTPEEDEQLAQLVRAEGTKWAQFSQVLNRHPEDLRDRYRNYVVCADRRETDAWAADEIRRLLVLVQEFMDDAESSRTLEPGNKRYQRPIEQLVNWQEVSRQLGSRSRLQCLAKWRTLRDD